MLLAQSQYILKPMQSRLRGEFEVAFYEEIEVSTCFTSILVCESFAFTLYLYTDISI
jgi:hypothetical protein